MSLNAHLCTITIKKIDFIPLKVRMTPLPGSSRSFKQVVINLTKIKLSVHEVMNYYANDYAPLVAAKIHFKITPNYILVQPRGGARFSKWI